MVPFQRITFYDKPWFDTYSASVKNGTPPPSHKPLLSYQIDLFNDNGTIYWETSFIDPTIKSSVLTPIISKTTAGSIIIALTNAFASLSTTVSNSSTQLPMYVASMISQDMASKYQISTVTSIPLQNILEF